MQMRGGGALSSRPHDIGKTTWRVPGPTMAYWLKEYNPPWWNGENTDNPIHEDQKILRKKIHVRWKINPNGTKKRIEMRIKPTIFSGEYNFGVRKDIFVFNPFKTTNDRVWKCQMTTIVREKRGWKVFFSPAAALKMLFAFNCFLGDCAIKKVGHRPHLPFALPI